MEITDKKTMMENLAREAYERGVFNGIWLYAENGKVISKGAYGFRDAEDKLPMQEDSIFELASVTKQFTAAAIMLLKREGLLCLDDKITKFFPELTAYKDVTIHHLLTHTGGVPDNYNDDDCVEEWIVNIWQKEKKIPQNRLMLRFLAESGKGPRFVPGEKYEYSNTGYNLLAEIVELLSGIPFEDYLRKNIFEPAGMNATGVFHVWRDGFPNDQFVRDLVLEDGKYLLQIDSKKSCGETALDGLNGDAHVFTTVFDMLKWDLALRKETVLTREEQQCMYTPARLNNGTISGADDELDGYGYGWGIIHDQKLGLLVNHSGGMPGLGTWYERCVDTNRVFVFLQSRDYKDARAYWSFAYGMVSVSRDNEPEPITSLEDIVIRDPDKSKWKTFCGKYEHPEDGEFMIDEIFLKDGELYAAALDADEDSFTFRLYPIGENEFVPEAGTLNLKFKDGCIMYIDFSCKKL